MREWLDFLFRSSSKNNNLSDILISQDKIDEYMKAYISSSYGNEKHNPENLMAMWMYATQMGNLPRLPVRKVTSVPTRPIVLIPAASEGSNLMGSPNLPSKQPPAGLMTVPIMHYNMTLPYIRPGSVMYAHGSGSFPRGPYKAHKITREFGINSHNRRRRNLRQQPSQRTGKREASYRQRRKSETDALAFTYTGLDREIADSFLERQEQSIGSHIDFSSSGSELSPSVKEETSLSQRVATRSNQSK